MFNKASFTLTGIDMVNNANDLSAFARMIIEKEKALNAPIVPVEKRDVITPEVKTKNNRGK